jgi:hypothetical protein
MTDVTTIKVSKPLRQRIADDAAAEGVSAETFLERLAVGHDYRAGVDQDYVAEMDAWEVAARDGLDGD